MDYLTCSPKIGLGIVLGCAWKKGEGYGQEEIHAETLLKERKI